MKIKLTAFSGYNPEAFANLTNGSIHEVLKKTMNGWVIKGSNGEDVLILFHEAIEHEG